MEYTFNVENIEDISDGSHTFKELYHHRMVLFSVICNMHKEKAWKSKLHADGTMYENYFIVGVDTRYGQYTYHYHLDNWGAFEVKELEKAPEYDGHKPEDLHRVLSLVQENSTFGFGEAIKHLKAGSKVRRAVWSDDVYINAQFPDENSKMTAPYLYVHSRYGNVPWKETMIEMFAEDWEILK